MLRSPADRYISRISTVFARPYSQGLVLLSMTLIALFWANSSYYESYFYLLEADFTVGFSGAAITEPLHKWINDGLMAVFFLVVGLEIKKEFVDGELSTPRKAALPILAALGGMVIPVGFFLLFNWGRAGQVAWGVPMATDIVFALSILTVMGRLVSHSMRTFMTALATADDIGAILVIALFLTPFINLDNLLIAGIYLSIMAAANFLGVRNVWFYFVVGVLGLWISIMLSGIHATLAGVLAAMTIPGNRSLTEREYLNNARLLLRDFDQANPDSYSPLNKGQDLIIRQIMRDTRLASTPLQRLLRFHRPLVSYFILPLFTLANAGVRIEGNLWEMLLHPLSLGIIVGLTFGKLIGITVFSYLGVRSGWGSLPVKGGWRGVIGLGIFGGIGFTMALFIAELSLREEYLLSCAKVGILSASLLAAICGIMWFVLVVKPSTPVIPEVT